MLVSGNTISNGAGGFGVASMWLPPAHAYSDRHNVMQGQTSSFDWSPAPAFMLTAGQGVARHGWARPGKARQGAAGQGMARQGRARQGITMYEGII